MRSRTLGILLRPVAVIALVMLTFVLGNAGFRQFEAAAATLLLHGFGTPANRVLLLSSSSIAVFPEAVGPFVAVIAPSCSALSALLAVASLSWFVPRGRTGRRLAALACALGCVLVGNVLRIAGSIAVGLVNGKPSLVLFHDWVGSLFAFSYTLGGYLLMLFLLLPAGPGPAVHTIRAAPAAVAARGGRGAHRVSV
jgi:exosortase/archaeosortase family protein